LIDDYTNAVKQMKEVINKAYDEIDAFIGKTLATANQAIKILTNVIDYLYDSNA
jgi:DNA-binding ferritin-like protein (Dps family)